MKLLQLSIRILPLVFLLFFFTDLQATEDGHKGQEVPKVQYAGLSIDGGGVKSLVTLRILETLESSLNEQNKRQHGENAPYIPLCEVFDYVGGTSVGGALAVALTYRISHGGTLNTWLMRFLDARNDLFPKTRFNRVSQWIWGSRYSPVKYETRLNQWFGDCTLKDLKTNVLITTIDLDTQKPYIFTKEKAIMDDKHNFFLRDVLRATTAVPTQYPAHQILSPSRTPYLVDGALCFNNTSQFVFNRIFTKSYEDEQFRGKRLPASHRNVFMLSLGGNDTTFDINYDAGMLSLGTKIVQYFGGGANNGVHREMIGLLGSNYQRISPMPKLDDIKGEIKFDDTSEDAQEKLEATAKVLLEREKSRIDEIAKKLLDIKKERENPTEKTPASDNNKTAKRTYTALSIDGGGIRGLIPAKVLEKIEEKTGKPINELFDYIGGTSSGGLLTLGLTVPQKKGDKTPRYKAADLTSLFTSEERFQVFSASKWDKVKSLWGLRSSMYYSKAYEKLLYNKLEDFCLSDALTNILITATEAEAKRMVLFCKDGKDTGIKSIIKGDFLMREVARSTSAAPSYFRAGQVIEPEGIGEYKVSHYNDGGICCNNPSQIIWNRLQREYDATPENVYVVSLGTGTYDPQTFWGKLWKCTKNSCIFKWLPNLVGYFMNGNSWAVHYEMEHLLGKNYKRIQPTMKVKVDLAEVNKIDRLNETAASIQDKEIDEICERLKEAGRW